MTTTLRRSIATVLLTVGISVSSSVHAQDPGETQTPARVPVAVVLVDQLPHPGSSFLVERRSAETPHDVIVLTRRADAATLSEAIRTLIVARQAGGDTATTSATIRMRPGRAASARREPLPWAQRVIDDLRGAEFQEIAGFGRVRAVQIWLPPQHRRSAAHPENTRQPQAG